MRQIRGAIELLVDQRHRADPALAVGKSCADPLVGKVLRLQIEQAGDDLEIVKAILPPPQSQVLLLRTSARIARYIHDSDTSTQLNAIK